jgi:hypothetical protein
MPSGIASSIVGIVVTSCLYAHSYAERISGFICDCDAVDDVLVVGSSAFFVSFVVLVSVFVGCGSTCSTLVSLLFHVNSAELCSFSFGWLFVLLHHHAEGGIKLH